jgi:hypothetical protein
LSAQKAAQFLAGEFGFTTICGMVVETQNFEAEVA